MRCGSTWLYEVLRCHPDIFMSERKEIDFFFMQQMLYYDISWYAGHFAKALEESREVRGEISPRYARLKAWQVKKIAEFLPDLRILLTIRHPFERIWSQACYDFGHLHGRDVQTVGRLEFIRQFERARTRLSSDYCRIIANWSQAFSREALLIELFERIELDPEGFVKDTLAHIGADCQWSIPPQFIRKKVHATKKLIAIDREIPECLKCYIAQLWLEPTKRLNELLQGKVSHWVDDLLQWAGRRSLSLRVLSQVNKYLLMVPETVAYGVHDSIRDIRLWWRWRQLLQTTQIQRHRSDPHFSSVTGRDPSH